MKRALDIRRIRVRRACIDIELSCLLSQLYVDEQSAHRILSALPNLACHVCVNDEGPRFGDCLVGTTSAHLLEHTILELLATAHAKAGATDGAQCAASAAAPEPAKQPAKPAKLAKPAKAAKDAFIFAGHTSWLDELARTRSQGIALMRTSISYLDDFMALKAIGLSRDIVEWALAYKRADSESLPDINLVINEIIAARRRETRPS